MDQEVAKTLSELELKLQELERELTSIGRRDASPESPDAPGKLIDEALEQDAPPGTPGQLHATTPPPSQSQGYFPSSQRGSPQPSPPPDPSLSSPSSGARPSSPSPSAPHPSPTALSGSIDVAELVRFKEKLRHTMEGLIDEYSRLLPPKPPS